MIKLKDILREDYNLDDHPKKKYAMHRMPEYSMKFGGKKLTKK